MSTLSQKIDTVINVAHGLHMLDDRHEATVEDLRDMLDSMPPQLWRDANLKFVDPQSGRGILGLLLLQRLHAGLRLAMPDEQERLNHILGKMLLLGDVQEDMCLVTKAAFSRAIKATGLESTANPVASGELFGDRYIVLVARDGYTVVGTYDPKGEEANGRLIVLAPPSAHPLAAQAGDKK